jgi:CheY-like chemotaxis protein
LPQQNYPLVSALKKKPGKSFAIGSVALGIVFAHTSRGDGQIMRVLVVDDNEIFCRLLAEILRDEGMDATWTTDVVAAYDEMSTDPGYDLFILDVRMPLILGTELAEAFRTTHPRAKIILVSAFADESLLKISQSMASRCCRNHLAQSVFSS